METTPTIKTPAHLKKRSRKKYDEILAEILINDRGIDKIGLKALEPLIMNP